MKQKLLKFAVVLLMLVCYQPLAAQYFDTGIDSTRWYQMTGNAVTLVDSAASDTIFGPFNIGFPFTFAGEQYTQFCTNKWGLVKFGSSGSDGWDVSQAANAPGVVAYGNHQGDLPLKCVSYEVFGTSPNRTAVYEFLYYRSIRYGTTNRVYTSRYQVQLMEANNHICVVYDTISWSTFWSLMSDISVGASSGQEYFFISDNSPVFQSGVVRSHPESHRYYEFLMPTAVTIGDLTYRDDSRTTIISCNPNVRSVVIPNTVVTIGAHAFENCYNLTSVTIPNSVVDIWDYAFSNCSSLSELVIPNSVANIGNNAFSRCVSLTELVLPNSVSNIGSGAFSQCSAITTLSIGDNDITAPQVATTIGGNAFAECYSLSSISWKDNIVAIGGGAFNRDTSLTCFSTPDSLAVLGENCLAGCFNIKVLTFGEKLYSYNASDSIFVDTIFFNNPSASTDRNMLSILSRLGNRETALIVPCGALDSYRQDGFGGYGTFGRLMSRCSSVVITTATSDTCMIAVPIWCNAPYTISHTNNGDVRLPSRYDLGPYYYEPGEKVVLYARPVKHSGPGLFDSHTAEAMADYWSNGSVGAFTTFIADTSDTIVANVIRTAYAVLDTNNVHAPIKVYGSTSYIDNKAQYYFLSDSTATIFSSGLWVAGLAGDSIFTATDRYSLPCENDYTPGPYQEDGTMLRWDSLSWSHVWKVGRNQIDYHISNVGNLDYEMDSDLANWPGPFVDIDGDSIYTPLRGDYPLIRGDQAAFAIFNDNVPSSLSNRHANPGRYDTIFENTNPMGLEIHMLAYEFNDTSEALNNTMFVNYKIYNKSHRTYKDCYFGMFTDFDLGYLLDDFIGCDVKRGLSYAYNGDDEDGPGRGAFAGVPPAQGVAILGGARIQADGVDNPKVDIEKMRTFYLTELQRYANGNGYDTVAITHDADSYYPNAWYFEPGDTFGNSSINGMNFGNGIVDDERLGMTNHMYYNNSLDPILGEPVQSYHHFNYTRSLRKNGSPIYHGVDNNSSVIDNSIATPTTFMYPGDTDPLHWGTNGVIPSVLPNDWSEITSQNTPGDRRTLSSSGPFTFRSGEMQEFDLAFISAKAENGTALTSVELLQKYTDDIRNMFYQNTTSSGKTFAYIPQSGTSVNIEQVEYKPSIKLYPNPAKGFVTIETNAPDHQIVRLFNSLGAEVSQHSLSNGKVTIDLRNLPSGIYYIRCNGTTNKLVKR